MNEPVMRISLLGTILEAEKARSAVQICAQYGCFFHLAMPAKGMASSELLDVLGLGEKKWTLTLSLVPQPLLPELRQTLRDALLLVRPNMGILFTSPLSGINARAAKEISGAAKTEQWKDERGKRPVTEPIIYDLILAVTNLGHSEDVMQAARQAGASGGTLLHTRLLGEDQAAGRFLGIDLQKEKELVAILARHDAKTGIMQAIVNDTGPDTPAETVVLALPVDGIAGLR